MWTYQAQGNEPADVRHFIDQLQNPSHPALQHFFKADKELTAARAPGRMDLMGGIADYSGSLVLQVPIAEAACCAVQTDIDDGMLHILSLAVDASEDERSFSCPMDQVVNPAGPISYAEAKALFTGEDEWAAYLAGTLVVLLHKHPRKIHGGIRIALQSAVPAGKGVSSSAAIEVACMQALQSAWQCAIDGPSLARYCQEVENHIVGAPCGLMDQMTSACGEEGQILALRCQPDELLPTITLPSSLAIWGIDSGIRHAVGGADYGSVRCAAFMGYRILADIAGLPVHIDNNLATITDTRWAGYLANVSPSEWAAYADHIPTQLNGAEFIQRYGATSDPITCIEPERNYHIRAATAHPILEHHRIRCFAQLLGQPDSPERNRLLGESMLQSHASYNTCVLGSDGTDALVAAVKKQGDRLFGAKITGGGSGGTVAILGQTDASPLIDEIAQSYQACSQRHSKVFTGSSPGAMAFGHRHLFPQTASRHS